jgi:hypothetical protein
MSAVVRPDWWCYPLQCPAGHPWAPGRVTVGWMPCDCPNAAANNVLGHLWVRCRADGCPSIWYRPRHEPPDARTPYARPIREALAAPATPRRVRSGRLAAEPQCPDHHDESGRSTDQGRRAGSLKDVGGPRRGRPHAIYMAADISRSAAVAAGTAQRRHQGCRRSSASWRSASEPRRPAGCSRTRQSGRPGGAGPVRPP